MHDVVRELHYIEVSRAHLDMRIGTEVLKRLVKRFSDAHLILSSDSAVGFWSRQPGWERFNQPEGLTPEWVVFVSSSLR